MPEDESCPHCGSVLDVARALAEDEAAIGRGRRHSKRLPRPPPPEPNG